jgi:hypothetical protein
MFVSRKLYAETRILPFQLNTFVIPDGPYVEMMVKLTSDAQLRVISSVSLDYLIVMMRRLGRRPPDTLGIFPDVSGGLPLNKLPGLRRVLVQNYPIVPASMNPGAIMEELRRQVQKDCDREDVKVVFEQAGALVDEKWEDYDSELSDDSEMDEQ